MKKKELNPDAYKYHVKYYVDSNTMKLITNEEKSMFRYKTINATLVSVSPIIKGDNDKVLDRRLIGFYRIKANGEEGERMSAYLIGNDAHNPILCFGCTMEMTYFSMKDGSKVIMEYKFQNKYDYQS